MRFLLTTLGILAFQMATAQPDSTINNLPAPTVRGIVTDAGNASPLVGATVYWLRTPAGGPSPRTLTGTTTDVAGRFALPVDSTTSRLVVSYVGYQPDTLNVVDSATELTVSLRAETTLQEVTVTASTSQIDRLNPIQTELITQRTLAKAACCNLSESFETNASVSVQYADAVTGARQIQFLGLGGQYVQSNIENLPSLRGLGTTFGLSYVPGTWITSIDVGKGAGSVVNGYEAMTGQLNVELQKPDSPDRLFLNGYVNSFGRLEGNLNWSQKLGKRWSVATLGHASTLQSSIDQNRDGFLDLPQYTQLNVLNRWKYATDRWVAQFGVWALHETRDGGQTERVSTVPRYTFTNTTRRLEGFAKMARLFPDRPYRGLGLILNAVRHEQDARFGFRPYAGQQQSFYANLIYQSIIDNTNHTFRTGLSYLLDDYRERFENVVTRTTRTESVPGAFFEYTYTYPEKLTLVLGGRADWHNLFGPQLTPRLHAKYHLTSATTLRASAGRGFRVPNALAENYGFLVSSRAIIWPEPLRPEISWNYGAGLTNEFQLFGRKASLVLDYFRTNFQNQLMVDLEHPGELHFHNLYGKSFANSFQAELNYAPAKRLEIKAAYRLFDVRQSMTVPSEDTLLLPRMMVPRDRVLLNVGYALPFDKWKFDATLQWNGRRRIAYLRDDGNYAAGVPLAYAPGFFNLNAQVSRAFRNGLEVYLGGENLTGFRQTNPIVAPGDPFGPNFDAAGRAWGPITGAMIYTGFRYKLPQP